MSQRKVLIIGCGSAALCAGIAALEAGADVTILEKRVLKIRAAIAVTPRVRCSG